MLEQVFRVVFEFASDVGVEASGARRACRKAERSVARSPYRFSEAVKYQTLHQIAEILSAWYLEPAYLDEQGNPRALPLTGVKSFDAVCRRFLPGADSREMADMLVAEGLLWRDSHGHVVPVRRFGRFASDSALMLDRIPMFLHAYLSTLRHNADPAARSAGTYCEQGTVIEQLPVDAIPAFNDFVKTLGKMLLNQTDTWASQRQSGDLGASHRRHARVGVEVYSFVVAEEPPRRRRTTR